MLRALAYRTGLTLARALSPLASLGSSKVARSLRGRRESLARFRAWAAERTERDPLVWYHAPSVGEGFQALAIREALAAVRPDVRTAFTYFSASAEGLPERHGVDVAAYLPWDVPSQVEAALDTLQPALIAFTKTEVWPELAAAASRRGIPTALVAATLPETSSRLTPWARWLLAPAFSGLDLVLAVSERHGRRFSRLGVREERVRVTGDPGVDSAVARAGAADPGAPYLAPFPPGAPRLIAGSTWRTDEDVVLPAARRWREAAPTAQLVIAPHEPTPAVTADLESRLRGDGWRVRRLSEVERGAELRETNAVVVDRVGVLAHLYTVGSVAYVGGGFHGHGLHSVLEPAAAGVPVLFGPRHTNASAAALIAAAGGGAVVDGVASLSNRLERWTRDEADRVEAGRAALSWIGEQRGASRRSAEALVALMERRDASGDP